jgi:hypothetical protein
MTEKHGFLEALKHVAFEDEPETPAKHAPPTTTPSAAPATFPSRSAEPTTPPVIFAHPIDAGVVPDTDAVYQNLFAKTDFESTPEAGTIHKFLDPLKAIPDTVMPANIKFKTAVLQASAQAGLTEDGILGAFETLKARLQQERDAFSGKAQVFAAKEVKGRQDQIQQITEQITELQQELARLSNELVEAQGKSTRAQSQFEAAVQRRNSELEQQKALYASLLKG